MLAVWNHIENPLAYAIPFFFAFVGIEAALLRVAGDHENSNRLLGDRHPYQRVDGLRVRWCSRQWPSPPRWCRSW